MSDMRKLINIITEAYQTVPMGEQRPMKTPTPGVIDPRFDDTTSQELAALEKFLSSATSPEDSPEEASFRSELKRIVDSELENLPADQAKAMRVWMAHDAKMTPSKVGPRMDPPITNVRGETLIRKALKTLRNNPQLKKLWAEMP